MNWELIFSGTRCTRRSTRRRSGVLPRRRRPQRARRLHRPAQLRPGRIRRRRRLRVRHPDRRTTTGRGTRRCRSCSSASITAGAPARPADAAAARRLPRDRHDRRRRDHPLLPQLGAVHVADRRQRRQERAGRSSSRTSTRGRTTAGTRLGAQTFDGYRLFMLLLGWTLVALYRAARLGADAQPVGPRAQEHPRGRGRGPRPRQERVAFKMQSLMLGGLIGSLGGLMLAAQTQSAHARQFATTLTFFAFTIIILGGIGRVKGPIVGTVIFFFVIQFVDNLLQQATRHDKLPDWLRRHRTTSARSSSSSPAWRSPHSWCSGRRASSATAESRSSMSAELSPHRRGAAVENRPGRAQARPDPRRRRRSPGVRRPRRRRRRPRRGPARRDHRADRAERRRQDDVLQPAHRLRRAGQRAVDVRRRDVAGTPPHQVARLGMVRTFQLTKASPA